MSCCFFGNATILLKITVPSLDTEIDQVFKIKLCDISKKTGFNDDDISEIMNNVVHSK